MLNRRHFLWLTGAAAGFSVTPLTAPNTMRLQGRVAMAIARIWRVTKAASARINRQARSVHIAHHPRPPRTMSQTMTMTIAMRRLTG